VRIGDLEVFGPSRPQIAEVMQESLLLLIAIGTVPTARTAMSCGGALTAHMIWGAGRSSRWVMPSVGSGRYAPGPNMLVPCQISIDGITKP